MLPRSIFSISVRVFYRRDPGYILTTCVYVGETLGIFWPDKTRVQLNWSGMFIASKPLVYVLNFGEYHSLTNIYVCTNSTDSKFCFVSNEKNEKY